MEQYLIPLALIGGLIFSVVMTKLFNWYAWGENKYKKDAIEHRMKSRMSARKETRKDDDQQDS